MNWYMFSIDRSSTEPLYHQVKVMLENKIQSGSYVKNQSIPTERELATELGLSRLTVRRAMVELAKQGLLRRVPGRGTFVNPEPRVPSGRSTPADTRETMPTIAFVSEETSIPHGDFTLRLLNGLRDSSKSALLTLRTVGRDPSELLAGLKADRSVRGIVALWITDATVVAALSQTGLPTVLYECIEPPEGLPPLDAIAHGDEVGAYNAVRALILAGHQDIACLTQVVDLNLNTEISKPAHDRQEGYIRAMRKHGLPVDPGRIHTVVPSGSASYAMGRRLLSDPSAKRPTAFFCSDDMIAAGLMAAARDLGVHVPNQLSVVGFGDLGVFSSPALSSVRMEIESSGREAIRLLEQRMADPQRKGQRLILPTEYIARSSVGPPGCD